MLEPLAVGKSSLQGGIVLPHSAAFPLRGLAGAVLPRGVCRQDRDPKEGQKWVTKAGLCSWKSELLMC